ncbi:hypothetical protein BO70DRAFT_2078 [Aspergillus heteromorphus CBS 117.55]|uniref:Uncharacterized protein n=1 Tax=Aspergillus heteromorphus CBS 117.55 TaxID=1448321 RepID=A0A317X1R1_9EURO|nr:uncharacterized protein BO70DRAFT_2078 [Aspergillus heteromorphus CBS 117.55]PWY92071.1 hypothetical protein BO70DRAFT_2078 [Aspergillus heteromorphus CBS 117.55]
MRLLLTGWMDIYYLPYGVGGVWMMGQVIILISWDWPWDRDWRRLAILLLWSCLSFFSRKSGSLGVWESGSLGPCMTADRIRSDQETDTTGHHKYEVPIYLPDC